MRWKIEVSPEAYDEFYSLSVQDRTRIREKLRCVVKEKLPTARAHSLSCYAPGWHSLRIGKYRIVFVLFRGGAEIKEIHYGTMRIFGVLLRKCQTHQILHKRFKKYGCNDYQ